MTTGALELQTDDFMELEGLLYQKGGNRDNMLKISEAAKSLQITSRTVLNWIKSGKLPAANFGYAGKAVWRIKESDFDRFLAESEATPSDQ